jgi:hypothetical protein
MLSLTPRFSEVPAGTLQGEQARMASGFSWGCGQKPLKRLPGGLNEYTAKRSPGFIGGRRPDLEEHKSAAWVSVLGLRLDVLQRAL